MSTYQTEEEQVEAIKNWWKENGKSVIGGIVLGLAIIGGWQGWQGYRQSQGENASLIYDSMHRAVQLSNIDEALELGKRLIGEYDGTAYASFAALGLARLAYQRGEKSVARGHLRHVAETAGDPALRDLARLRLGALLLDMNELPLLGNLLSDPPQAAFAGEFAALRGDLELARGDREAARDAYQEALIQGVAEPALVRFKLIDAGGTPAAS